MKSKNINAGIVVLSLFNGMSTGHLALDNINVKVKKYYSSEIKKHAIKLTQHHYPNTVQLGDVNNWRNWGVNWGDIDLLLSGSPCKDLSIAGRRAGINGSNSGLFWVFIEILNHIKKINPNVIFFQENVGSANIKDIGVMSRAMGVYPIRLNSSLLTAQLRDRYYWTNGKVKPFGMFGDLITDIPAPIDKKIFLINIITDGWTDKIKANCILESESRMTTNQESLKKRYSRDFCTVVYVDNKKNVRMLNKSELCKLQGFPYDYCDLLSRNKAASLLGDGWTLPIIEHIFKHIFNK